MLGYCMSQRIKNEQRAIAHILGTLDDKIELNRRMNETMEGMARAIFKSWFVDFDPVRAKMRVMVKRILRRYGYPPDKQEKATQTVLEQAEVLAREWTVA